MKRSMTAVAIMGVLALVACQKKAADFWFQGDFQAAQTEAPQRGGLIMVEFFTDW